MDREWFSFQLLELRPPTGAVIWARRYDARYDDPLVLLDNISSQVAAQVEGELRAAEARRVLGPHTGGTNEGEASDAYKLLLRAQLNFKLLSQNRFELAGSDLKRVIELDPKSAQAHAWYALWHNLMIGQGWAKDIQAAIDQSDRHVELAIELDPDDACALTICGHTRAFLQRRLSEAAALHDRALSLNPNLAMAWAFSAVTHAYRGDIGEAEKRYKKYKHLSASDPISFLLDGFGTLIELIKRDNESAVANAVLATQLAPMLTAGLKPYLSALGHLGEGHTQPADAVRRRILSIEPQFSLDSYTRLCPLSREDDRAYITEGLRLAGISWESAGCNAG